MRLIFSDLFSMHRANPFLTVAIAVLMGMAFSNGSWTMQSASAANIPLVQDGADADPSIDGPTYPISTLELRYIHENQGHMPVNELMDIPITMGTTSSGYVAPREGVTVIVTTLRELSSQETHSWYASAIQHMLVQYRDYFVDELSYLAVFVAPDPFQISELGVDMRGDGQSELTILVTTGVVTELRTLASGKRFEHEPENRVNHPAHTELKMNSPAQPYDGTGPHFDLILVDQIDEYVFLKSRHPGRRLDYGVSAAVEPGTVALDYTITENKQLSIYAQVSNTGTSSTDYLRQRVGFFHTQLTNNDDILSMDFNTAAFDNANSLNASYDARIAGSDRARWRLAASWSEFTADEVGFFGDDFTGESWSLDLSARVNIHQDRELFVDAVGGARFLDVKVDQGIVGEGHASFLVPYVGIEVDQSREWSDLSLGVFLEFMDGDWTGNPSDDPDLPLLGRTAPDNDWTLVRVQGRYSVFLEPLLNQAAWEDPSTPKSSTLAHELVVRGNGQWGFGHRLVPQAQAVAGGLYSVRGYPESVSAGDNVFVGSVEYRYYINRDLEIEPEPRMRNGKPFRVAPQHVYGGTDEDWILKAFSDFGRTTKNDRLGFESNETLWSVGIGVEYRHKRNFRFTIDWGFSLDELESGNYDDGQDRLHFVATFLF